MELDLNKTNLHGKLGAILCWADDLNNMPAGSEDEDDGHFIPPDADAIEEAREDQDQIGKAVAAITHIVAENWERVSTDTLWRFCEAIGVECCEADFKEDEALRKVYGGVQDEYHRRLKEQRRGDS